MITTKLQFSGYWGVNPFLASTGGALLLPPSNPRKLEQKMLRTKTWSRIQHVIPRGFFHPPCGLESTCQHDCHLEASTHLPVEDPSSFFSPWFGILFFICYISLFFFLSFEWAFHSPCTSLSLPKLFGRKQPPHSCLVVIGPNFATSILRFHNLCCSMGNTGLIQYYQQDCFSVGGLAAQNSCIITILECFGLVYIFQLMHRIFVV